MSKKQIYKPKPVSGFPEWLPEARLVEQKWFDHIRRIFESYGFASIETPSVEELDVIFAKGGDGEADVDKEVYVIERLHKEDGDKESRLALHFDQTVPLARYVAQHFNDLTFPFKRYQMQRVWRGERPQAGRFREFYQCDIDVINVDNLPLAFDAEVPAIIWEVLSSLPGMENETIKIRINNRKILMGLLDSMEDITEDFGAQILRLIDKREKISEEEFAYLLNEVCSNSGNAVLLSQLNDIIKRYLIIADEVIACEKLSDQITKLKEMLRHFDGGDMLAEGIEELIFVLEQLQHMPDGSVTADLAVVRGLDYYTGTVYETVFVDAPEYGSICSGGRYDDLAGNYINKSLPGVGISIGFSRLFDRLRQQGKLPVSALCPTDVLVVLPNEEKRGVMHETARALRERGMNVETYHAPQKIGKQLSYAEKKGIRYVWFPPFDDEGEHEVKDMQKGEQSKANPASWAPDEKALDDAA